jgi:short-subunit dehydrogenase
MVSEHLVIPNMPTAPAKTCLITGATSGIGLVAARELRRI